jgi:lipoate-protein ligase B
MLGIDLGLLKYTDAWAAQEAAHAEVAAGGEPRVLIVEHPPVITFGRRGDTGGHLLASEEQLRAMGVELVHSDRGGDITFHGPGQVVAYPIVRLADHQLSVGGYVHRLESAVVGLLAEWGISAKADPAAVGVWVRHRETEAKICAIGVRIRKGASLHGVALNVNTDLSFFNLIVPCGLAGRPVTSLRDMLGDRAPGMDAVRDGLFRHLARAFGPVTMPT